MPGSRKTGKRDVEKVYPRNDFIAKLRRLADAQERGGPFRIQVAGERIVVPQDAAVGIEHEREREGGVEEIEFQIKWRTGRRLGSRRRPA